MELLKKVSAITAVLVTAGVLVTVFASPSDKPAILPYRILNGPAPAPGKIEVIEFFWYSCPHCHEFEPRFAEWAKKNAESIVVKRVPVGIRPAQAPQQKMFYVVESLPNADAIHKDIFQQIHVGKKLLDSEVLLADYAAALGMGRPAFHAAYNSEPVLGQMRAATQLHKDLKVDSVPTVVIGGRYVTSPAMLGATLPLWGQTPEQRHDATLKMMDSLLAKSKKQAQT